MMNSLRLRLSAVLLVLALLPGCVNKNVFGEEGVAPRTKQAELIAEFIDARYDRLERGLEQFERYVELVRTQAEMPETVFCDGQSILLIVDGGAQRLMAEFEASPRARRSAVAPA